MRFLVIALTLAFIGCTPKPGEKCKSEGVAACSDPQTQLVCKSGSYAAYSCKGAQGCSGKDFVCDISGNSANDACSPKNEGKKFCSADHKTRIRCEKGKVETDVCDGVGGCTSSDTGVDCNRSEPVIGEECGEHFVDQCSRDKSHTFHCENKKWVVGRVCRGPKRCESGTCDVTLALEGDSCGAKEETRSTCSVDGKSILHCESGHFKTESACPSGKSCTFRKPEHTWESLHNDINYPTLSVLLSLNAICE